MKPCSLPVLALLALGFMSLAGTGQAAALYCNSQVQMVSLLPRPVGEQRDWIMEFIRHGDRSIHIMVRYEGTDGTVLRSSGPWVEVSARAGAPTRIVLYGAEGSPSPQTVQAVTTGLRVMCRGG